MLIEFKKYQGINVLQFFLEHPETDIHIKELARRLDISPATSQRFCNLFASKKIVLSERKGNAIFFRLNESDPYVTLLKQTYAITRIREHWTPITIEGLKTIAVYGSQVSGEYTSQSDIDILILTRKKGDYPKIYPQTRCVLETRRVFPEIRDYLQNPCYPRSNLPRSPLAPKGELLPQEKHQFTSLNDYTGHFARFFCL